MDTKNANGFVGEPRRLFQMEVVAKMGDFFLKNK